MSHRRIGNKPESASGIVTILAFTEKFEKMPLNLHMKTVFEGTLQVIKGAFIKMDDIPTTLANKMMMMFTKHHDIAGIGATLKRWANQAEACE
jgi:hypothetical protein